MSSRLQVLISRNMGGAYVAEVGGAEGIRQRFGTPGEASRFVHDAVWAGPRGGGGTVSRRDGTPLARFTKIADRAVEVRNLTVGTVQYEYNPSTVRPKERHWSQVWPPEVIPYRESGAELA